MNTRTLQLVRSSFLWGGAALLLAGFISCLRPERDSKLPAHVPTDLKLTLFYDKNVASFSKPLWFEELPDEQGTFAIGGLAGDIKLLRVDSTGKTTVRQFAQIPVYYAPYTDGLLGAAFHPDFINNRKYYVYYTSARGEVKLVERMAKQGAPEDAGVERTLITLPVAVAAHYGGDLRFGPDGFLYLGIGDGARADGFVQAQDSLNADAQSLNVLYGKMIRIDVDGRDSGLPYAIPADNPFAGSADSGIRREVWAYGLRQPWRGSFDPVSGTYLVGDVGLIHSEEINLLEKGKNYGWRRMEGGNCFNDSAYWSPLSSCGTEGITPPVIEIKRPTRFPDQAIIGGHVFRGDTASPHYGAYIFGESSQGAIYYVPPPNRTERDGQKYIIAHASQNFGSFGTDSRGNLYVVEYNTGTIRRLDHPDLTGKRSSR